MKFVDTTGIHKGSCSAVACACVCALTFNWNGHANAQACPSPATVNDTQCTVAPGTTINVASVGGVGMNASGGSGRITGDAVTVNLQLATTMAALAQLGSQISLNNSVIATTATTTANAAGQIGVRATATGGIVADGATITMGPPNGTTTANSMTAATADAAGKIAFTNTSITMFGGVNGVSNYGLSATGSGSEISFLGGTISTISRGSFGVVVQDSGKVSLGNGASVTTSGAQITGTTTGSHALYALGVGSFIDGTNITITTSGTIASGARAEGGGRIDIFNSQVSTTGGNATTPSPAAAHALIATGAGSVLNASNVVATATGNLANGARAENFGTVNLISSQISTNSPANVNTQNPAAAAVSGGILNISGAGSTLTTGPLGRSSHGLLVQDSGSQAFVSDTAISVSANGANGVHLANGGVATIGNSTISNNGTSAVYGVMSTDAGSFATLNNTAILTTNLAQGARATSGGALTFNGGSVNVSDPGNTGNNRVGLWASLGGSITANDVAVTTQGQGGAHGVRADNPGTVITLFGGSITTTGAFIGAVEPPNGISARDRAQIVANGTTISTFGTGGNGVVSENSTITLSNNTVSTIGDRAVGLYATINTSSPVPAPSTLAAANITVETSGSLSHGAFAQQKNSGFASLLTLDNANVLTSGAGSVGLRAEGQGTVIANLTNTLTSGNGAHGVEAADTGSSVTFNNSAVVTSGVAAHGALANRGGLVVGNNATVFASGTDAMALYVAGDTTRISNARFSSSHLTNVSGPIIGVGGVGNVLLTDSRADRATGAAPGEWLRVGSIVNFAPLAAPETPRQVLPDLDGIIAAPPLLPAASPLTVVPGLANVTLVRSTVVGAAFTAPGSVSNVTLEDNSIWIMTGSSNVTNLVNDPSLIQFTPPTGDANLLSSYKTLTTVNYIGINGVIGLNTYLGGDSAPSDRLIIDGGNASGLSPLRIANTIGRGDLTRGNGILVVDAINGGTTVPGAFVLAGPVSAGPYDYTLHRSSIVDASNPDDWYLRSRINCALEPANPICAQPNPDPASYRPETSLYAALPSMALLYGRSLLDTLHERVGEEEDQRSRPNPENGKLGWARVIGVTGHQNGDPLGVYGSGPRYRYSFGGLQGGMDVYRHDKPDGSRDQAGVYFAIGADRGRVTHITGAQGDTNFDAYSLGGYWTHFGAQGWYTDTILQGTFYGANSSANRGIATLNTNGQGLAASIEAGHPFRFADGYFIEPQAQLIYQSISFNNASDGAALIRFDNVESLLGRIGARIGRTWAIDGGPRTVTAWIRPNLWNEFKGNPVTSFSSEAGFIPFRADLGGLSGEINIGASGQLSADTTLYANVSYQSRFDGRGSSYDGKVGLRYIW